jgi:hypothetical protein
MNCSSNCCKTRDLQTCPRIHPVERVPTKSGHVMQLAGHSNYCRFCACVKLHHHSPHRWCLTNHRENFTLSLKLCASKMRNVVKFIIIPFVWTGGRDHGFLPLAMCDGTHLAVLSYIKSVEWKQVSVCVAHVLQSPESWMTRVTLTQSRFPFRDRCQMSADWPQWNPLWFFRVCPA